MTLAPMLKHDGGVIGDFTVSNLGDGTYFIAGSGIAEDYHMRWFEQHLPSDGSVQIIAHGAGMVGLSIAGPNARKLLEAVTNHDVSAGEFKFMAISKMNIGMARALVGRVSFTGDLGFEIWCKPEYQCFIFDELMAAGADFGIRLFGTRALNSLRLEKSYGSWAREYRPIYSPAECGLSWFVDTDKQAEFIGKKAATDNKDHNSAKMRL